MGAPHIAQGRHRRRYCLKVTNPHLKWTSAYVAQEVRHFQRWLRKQTESKGRSVLNAQPWWPKVAMSVKALKQLGLEGFTRAVTSLCVVDSLDGIAP